MDPRRLALLPLLALAGCGGADPVPPAATAPAPALATAPRQAGEVVLRGELSPRVHGPIALNGRYRVRFVQYAPEDAETDFATQTPFVADLKRAADDPGRHLLRAARASGETTLTLHGRYLVDVSFGDFPYVLRFTRAG